MNAIRFLLRTWTVVVFALAVVSGVSSRAFAQEQAQPGDLKKRADAAMDALDHTAALALYSEAYGATHDPALLYNMGRAYEAMAQYPAALDKLVQFQQQATPDLLARVPNLAQRIARLRTQVSTVTVTSNVPGARVLLGNKQIGVTPLPGPLTTNAGKTTLEVVADGYLPLRKDVELPGGGSITIDAPLASKSTSGLLVVRSPNVGAEVTVDNEQKGTVPLELVVKAGSHALVIRKDGFETSSTSAVVGTGERKVVEIPLEATKPITAKWWFWTGVVVVVAAGAVTTYALLTERKADSGSATPGQVAGPLVHF